jgi:hypothetical protein
VCKTWRSKIDPRLSRHILVDPSRVSPIAYFSPTGRHLPVLFEHDTEATIALLRDRCRVVDLCETLHLNSGVCQPTAPFPLVDVAFIRRHHRSTGRFTFSSHTLVDFSAHDLMYQTAYRCDRYVVPNIAYAREDWRAPKISKLAKVDYQAPVAVPFHRLCGRSSYYVQEVVLLFLEGEVAELDAAFQMVAEAFAETLHSYRPSPAVTFVGLRPSARRGDSLREQLREMLPSYWERTYGPVAEQFEFLSHPEYREKVGEEQYALETNRQATVW